MASVPCPICSPARTVGRAAQAPFPVRRFGLVYSWAPFLTHSAVSQGATKILELFSFSSLVLVSTWSTKTPTGDGGHSKSSVLSGPSSTESDDLLPRHPAPALGSSPS